MARKATKDTYAIEEVGGVEVRRQVFAGDTVPDSYQLEDDSTEEVEDKSETRVGGEGTEQHHEGQETSTQEASSKEEPVPAYGDSADPKQKKEAEEQQSKEQQKSPQSPAGKRAGRDK